MLLIQHNTTPVQLCAGILNRFRKTSWQALLGTATNVAVSGLVALTSNSVLVKTANEPKVPHQIMNQKNGRSRKGRSCRILPIPPEMRTKGVRRRIESREV